MHNGPIVTPLVWQMGRWLPLLRTCRLAIVLARSPTCTYRNTCVLVIVFCISQLGWVQLHFGKCSGRFILCLTQRSAELSMHSEIVQQQEATDSDCCSSQTYPFSSFYSSKCLFLQSDFHEHHYYPVAAEA